MTMIAFTTSRSGADLLTDTFSYTHDVAATGHTSKFMLLPHFDAAIAAKGDGVFGAFIKVMLASESNTCETFDDLVAKAPEACRRVWADFAGPQGEDDGHIYDSTLYLIGYSHQLDTFAAYRFDSTDDFAGTRVEGTYVYPMPWNFRPAVEEVEEFRVALAETFGAEAAGSRADDWAKQPEILPPNNDEEWAALAQMVRKSRALQHFQRVLVGGKAIRTKIRRDFVNSKVIHHFNDTGDEFLKLIAGTDHPLARFATCVGCDSGKVAQDCCYEYPDNDPAPQP